MKKLALASIIIFFSLLSLQKSYDEKERAIADSLELNEEILKNYEDRISEAQFKDRESQIRYYDGYRGFLNWITETEYKEMDDEFRERVE